MNSSIDDGTQRNSRSANLEFDDLFQAAAFRLQADFLESRSSVRPDEIGAPREEGFRQFLKERLPIQVGVTHGYAINRLRQASRQLDFILYNQLTSPIFQQVKSDDRRLVPISEIYGAGEIKSTLGASELDDTISKLKDFQHLHYDLPNWDKADNNTPTRTAPFFVLFAYRLDNGFTLSDIQQQLYASNIFPDGVVILTNGIMVKPSSEAIKRYVSICTSNTITASNSDIAPSLQALRLNRDREYYIGDTTDQQLTLMFLYAYLLDSIREQKLLKSDVVDLLAIWRRNKSDDLHTPEKNMKAVVFILALLKYGSMTTAEINQAWKAKGRSGNAYSTLSKLSKDKKIKATPVKEGLGSRYEVA